MKRRIADWIYNFWFKNHTHYWEVHDPLWKWEKCRKCGEMRHITLQRKQR